MPRPNHLVTPTFGWEYPELGAEADVPTDLHEILLQIEAIVKALEPKFLKTAGVGDAGKLLVVSATGAPAFAAMSGDATIGNTGILSIGAEKVLTGMVANLAITAAKLGGESVEEAKIKALAVTAAKLAAEAVETAKIKAEAVTEAKLAALAVTAAKIANLAVTEGKIADAAVTSRKFKPTHGVLELSESKVCTAEMVLMPGMKLEITPATASVMRMWLSATWAAVPASTTMRMGVFVDGVEQEIAAELSTPAQEWPVATASNVLKFNLTAALHTIEIKARKTGVAGAPQLRAKGSISIGNGSNAMYELLSQ